jgi:hypothetical protein
VRRHLVESSDSRERRCRENRSSRCRQQAPAHRRHARRAGDRREIPFCRQSRAHRGRAECGDRRVGSRDRGLLDRTVVEKALRQAYNEEGFLKAEIAGRPLAIDGTVGVLWFDIKEGPRAQITSLKWAGVAESRAPDAEKAAASKRRRRMWPPT